MRVDAEDEEVDAYVKLKFFLPAEEGEYFEELLPLPFAEMGEELFFVVAVGGLVELEGGLEAII